MSVQEPLLRPFLICGSKTMNGRGKERSRIKPEQMDNLKNLLGIRKMDKVPNAWTREQCEVTKRVEERIAKRVH